MITVRLPRPGTVRAHRARLLWALLGIGLFAAPIYAEPYVIVEGQLSAANQIVFRLKSGPDRGSLRDVARVDAATLARALQLPRNTRIQDNGFVRWQRAQERRAFRLPDRRIHLDTHLILEWTSGGPVQDMLAHLRAHPWIDYAEPDGVGFGGGAPSDPAFSQQWHHVTIDSTNAWTITTGSTNVIVAVLDSGINLTEAEFAGRLVPGYNFVHDNHSPADDHGHGTAVTGVLAANANNDRLVAGVDWQCRIMPLKVLDSSNSGLYSWWADAVHFAVTNGAKVINLSAGGTGSSTPLTEAIQHAVSNGVIFITITHNDSSGTIRYPGTLPESITVGATDSDDTRSSFSNWGSQIDLVAPGRDIYTVGLNGTLQWWWGTSFSAPQVAGVAALLAALRPGINQEQARILLTAGSEDQVGNVQDVKGWDPYYGWGRLNAAYSLQLALTELQGHYQSDPAAATLTWEATGHAAQRQPYRIRYSRDTLSWTTLTNPAAIVYSGATASWTDDGVETEDLPAEQRHHYRVLITPEVP